jgi:cation channel sperm-associated protein 1
MASQPSLTNAKSNHDNSQYASNDTVANSLAQQMEGASFSRKVVVELVESQGFKLSILSIIILNALALGLETDVTIMKYFDWYLNLLNNVFLGIYMFELTIKIYSYRMDYFKSGWNVFDMLVILLTLIAWIVKENVDLSVELAKLLSIIRIFRALLIIRFIRELKGVPYLRSLQLIIDTISASFATIGSVGILAGIFLYLFTVVAVILFGDVHPQRFGQIGTAFVSTFQVITLDRWYIFPS